MACEQDFCRRWPFQNHVLRSLSVFRGRRSRAAQAAGIAALLTISIAVLGAGNAAWGESAAELQERLLDLEDEMQVVTADIERRTQDLARAKNAASETQAQIDELNKVHAKLEKDVVARARELYMSGNGQVLEVLFGSESIAELSSLAESLAQVNLGETDVFVRLARSKARIVALNQELFDRKREAQEALKGLRAQSARLQEIIKEVAAAYDAARDSTLPSAAQVKKTGGMFCPVAGPTSFVDSWGAPRSGHTHKGVDMMGAYGTPLVAVTSGTITYAAYDGSGGNMIFLSGDDGHAYWYMHNQQNLVSGGRVSAGQRIATLGDTGNAAGTPHLHFEYHPGGGGPVNPYPLAAMLCR